MNELLNPAQMYEADRLTIAAGTPGITLMENAGAACVSIIMQVAGNGRTCVVAGPGNNGGDGFVIARLLAEAGWPVTLLLAGDVASLKGDAALVAARWTGDVLPATPDHLDGAEVIVDALFGAGLARDIDGDLARLVGAINHSPAMRIAIDMPSGIDGRTGQVRGAAVRAGRTITFFRAKPGHWLMPGRLYCGRLHVADIGINSHVLSDIKPQQTLNSPALFESFLRPAGPAGHKYSRGHAVMVSGGATATGAARLAAESALRVGAGLVTVASPKDALSSNASHLTAIMLRRADTAFELAGMLSDRRITACGIGPAAGVGQATRDKVLAILSTGCAAVLDADSLTSFAGQSVMLFEAVRALQRPVILTPHEGEFSRLFNWLGPKPDSKSERAARAARESGTVVVLKGADTVIAAPDGRIAINANAPATLATAGSGDVLAGLCLGLLAQGLQGFEAACAAVWLHGEAGTIAGSGLTADDLPRAIATAIGTLTT